MAYFINCGRCRFQCEYVDPDDPAGASSKEAWEKPITCPRCGAQDELGQYWSYPSPMYNGGHHEEQIKLWETRWYPRSWQGNSNADGR